MRTAEPEDAPVFGALYSQRQPRSFLLDMRREIQMPTVDEIREVLSRKDPRQGASMMLVIEDKTGGIGGFTSLRPAPPEISYAELTFSMIDEADYTSPMAEEAFNYQIRLSFVERKLRKMIAQCLDNERGYRDMLLRLGFESCGLQRDVIFAAGVYHGLETFCLFNPEFRGDPHAD